MMLLFYILLPIYVGFCLWLGFRIIQKAGLDETLAPEILDLVQMLEKYAVIDKII